MAWFVESDASLFDPCRGRSVAITTVLPPPPPAPPLLPALPLAQAARPSAPAATTATATIGFAMSTSSASHEPPRTGGPGVDLGELITGFASRNGLAGY